MTSETQPATALTELCALLLCCGYLCCGCAINKAILVRSDPPGATVIVDGSNEGTTPTHISLPIPPLMPGGVGVKHTVVLTKSGYSPYQKILQDYGDLKYMSSFPDEISATLAREPAADAAPAMVQPSCVLLPNRTFPRRNIAVAPLEALGLAESETLTLTESLRVTLVDTDYFNLVNRSDMEKILKEQSFQRSECSDTQCLVEMGKILAVEKIVGGTAGRVGDTFSLTVRRIDVESGRIDASVVQDVKGREDALLGAIRQLGKSICLKYAESRTSP